MPSPYRSLAFGLKQSSVPLATFLSGLAIPFVALTLGWRWAFVLAAALAALLMASLLIFGPRVSDRSVSRGCQLPLNRDQARFFMALGE